MKVTVDFENLVGKIKPMHAVGQPPFKGGFSKFDFSPMGVLKDAHIPYSRLHDVGGPFGGNRFVDIPNIFRDFDADENDPASYDFAFTDELLKALTGYGVEPYYRLGVTIENQSFIKAYRIHPPKDYGKWARICEHVIRHYNEGWADGFYYNIKYWEIWNEPENREDTSVNQLWTGTAEQYYELYDITSKHLKKCFGDKIKVGGYGACGFYGIFGNPEKYGMNIERREGDRYNSAKEDYRLNFLYGFFDYIQKNNSPIDFFAWHTYDSIDTILIEADFVDNVLNEFGYGHIETHLNEWNLSHNRNINKGTSFASANTMALMLGMQHKKTDMLLYYDAGFASINAYAGFFDVVTLEPSCVYYSFKAFGELYMLKNEAECICSGDNVFAVAATDGERKSVIISNIRKDVDIEMNVSDEFSVYIIDADNFITKTDLNPKSFVLKENTVAVIKNY